MISRKFALAVLCLLLSAGFYRPGLAQQTNSPTTMTVVIESAPSDLDPASSYDENSNIPLRAFYEGLVTLKGSSLSETVPVLAESVDNQNDTVYTFKLHQGVKFHDGTIFDAAAAKFGLTRTVTAKLGTDAILGTFLTNPDKMIQVVDLLTLRITFDRPQPLFLVALAASYGTGLVSPTAVKQHTQNNDNAHQWLQTHEAGTGPYMLANNEMKADAPVTLKKFDGYWRGWSGSHFDQIVINVLPQSMQRRAALEKGQADAATVLLPEDLTKLQKANSFQFDPNPTLRVDFLIMAASYGPLQDPKARQAMAYAFDYAAYNRAELGNLGRQPNGPFPNTLLGADPSIFTYKTDLKKARQLLDEAGVKPGTELNFVAPQGRGDLAGVILKQQLEQIGLTLNIKKLDNDAYQALLTGDKTPDRPDFFLQSWWPDYNSPLNYSYPLFYSKSAGQGGQNAGYYADPKVDKQIEAAQNARTVNEMTQLFKDVQQIITLDDPAGIFMVQSPDRTVVSGSIKGQVFNVLYLGTFDFYALSRG